MRDDPRAQCWLCEPRGDASVSAMTQERNAEAQEDASVSAMTPGSTHPKKAAGAAESRYDSRARATGARTSGVV